MRKSMVWPMACLVMGSSLVSCSGGGGELAILASTIISGIAAIGPLVDSISTIYALDQSGVTGISLASVTTDPKGAFTADIGSYHGNILATVSGGTYTNPVTLVQASNPMPLRAAVPNISGNTWVSVTPLTEIATQTAGTLTPGNITAADILVSNMIGGIDIVTTKPSNVIDPAAALNTDNEKNYGLMLAAISQMVAQGTSPSVSEVISKIKNDLGNNYQLDTTGPEISAALEKFIPSPNNKTGLTLATAAIVPSIHAATIAPIKNPLVGTWHRVNQAMGETVAIFVDNANYFGANHIDSAALADLERGTYTWTLTTFTPTVTADTTIGNTVPRNEPLVTYSISGNIMTLPDSHNAPDFFTKVLPSASNPLIGSWYGTNVGVEHSTMVITFLDNSNFYDLVSGGDSVAAPGGQDGIERGTYTWTATQFTPTVIVDTNGKWGMSHPLTPQQPYTISGDVLLVDDSPNPPIPFTRVK